MTKTILSVAAAGECATYEYDQVLLVGRFQPFHTGHGQLLATALSLGQRVIVGLGSSFRARDPKNPFTWKERANMIRATLTAEEAARVVFLPVRDYYNDEKWVAAVTLGVLQNAIGPKTAVVGHFKDSSSYYLSKFPGWGLVECGNTSGLDATDLRAILFNQKPWLVRAAVAVAKLFGRGGLFNDGAGQMALLASRVPLAVLEFLGAFRLTPEFKRLVRENDKVLASKKAWDGSPYEPIFVTVDAVVEMDEHILLIRRAGDVGEGLLAVPGGYLEPKETLLNAVVRELGEETHFGIYKQSLIDALQEVQVFDHPDRSLRGRIVTNTHRFLFKGVKPADIRGNGTEGEPLWVHKSNLAALENQCFEDHFNQLDFFYGLTEDPREELKIFLAQKTRAA